MESHDGELSAAAERDAFVHRSFDGDVVRHIERRVQRDRRAGQARIEMDRLSTGGLIHDGAQRARKRPTVRVCDDKDRTCRQQVAASMKRRGDGICAIRAGGESEDCKRKARARGAGGQHMHGDSSVEMNIASRKRSNSGDPGTWFSLRPGAALRPSRHARFRRLFPVSPTRARALCSCAGGGKAHVPLRHSDQGRRSHEHITAVAVGHVAVLQSGARLQHSLAGVENNLHGTNPDGSGE